MEIRPRMREAPRKWSVRGKKTLSSSRHLRPVASDKASFRLSVQHMVFSHHGQKAQFSARLETPIITGPIGLQKYVLLDVAEIPERPIQDNIESGKHIKFQAGHGRNLDRLIYAGNAAECHLLIACLDVKVLNSQAMCGVE